MEEAMLFEVGGETVAVENNGPSYGSKEWHTHVMSFFDDSELIDGSPTCAGLRRVAEEILGDIVYSGPCQVFAATDPNGPGRATVVFEVVFENWLGSSQTRTFKEVADVWHGNTDDLFCAHPVATASTRAEGRALRKALKIKCLAAEELTRKKDVEAVVKATVKIDSATTGELNDKDKISSAQINFLDKKCSELNINVWSVLNSGSKKYANINEVSKKEASNVLTMINDFQNNSKACPDSLKGYDKNWRNAE
jgi:hypothetical protein